jgi:hypothetical protein
MVLSFSFLPIVENGTQGGTQVVAGLPAGVCLQFMVVADNAALFGAAQTLCVLLQANFQVGL